MKALLFKVPEKTYSIQVVARLFRPQTQKKGSFDEEGVFSFEDGPMLPGRISFLTSEKLRYGSTYYIQMNKKVYEFEPEKMREQGSKYVVTGLYTYLDR